ncbi:MAG: (2Fe-2S)-binding protein [Campylobacterota bacterium]|nr:(2Fe-2S)-binding protein [Campylobacterota bacterium]
MTRQFQNSFEVCKCKHVSLGEIIHAIKEKGATSIEHLGKMTDAGTVCGCCKSKEDDFTNEHSLYLDEILNKFASA